MRKFLMGAALALGTTAIATPATAQIQNTGGLVNVTVGDVILRDILTDVEVTALNDLDLLNNNQLQVQIPVGVAANVCGVSAAVLGKAGTAAACDAKSGSQALAQQIRNKHLKKK